MNRIKTLSLFIECSTGSTPTVENVKKYIKYAAAFGYKELYLGCTDAYKIDGEPYFNYNRGGYTTEDFQSMDKCAKEHNIELIASIQTLAHLHYLKKYFRFKQLFDTDNILMVGEPKVYEFIDKMFGAISKGLSSRKIHIGFDEAFGIGTGEYKKKYGQRLPGELIKEHLQKVIEIAEKYGYKCEIWSDMLLSELKDDADSIHNITKSVNLIHWDYRNIDSEVLDKNITECKRFCDNISYAGAAWKICGFAPRNGYSISRFIPQLDACERNGVDRYMVTLWSDGGAQCSIFSVLPAIYACAEYAFGRWNGQGEPNTELFYKTVKVPYEDFMSLDYLNDPKKKKRLFLNSRSYWILYSDVLLGNYECLLSEGTGNAYGILKGEYAEKAKGEYEYLFSAASSLAAVLEIKSDIGILLKKGYKSGDKALLNRLCEKDFPQLIERLNGFISVFERYWKEDNYVFGLEVNQVFLGGILARVKYAFEMLKEYLQSGKTISEIDGELLPPDFDSDMDEDKCFETNYRYLMSYCNM